MKLLPRGVVTLGALDLRRHPAHTSEMKSQLLLGETVRVLQSSRDLQWWRVRNDRDGYEGWVRNWGVVPCSAERARRWNALAKGWVSVASAEVRAGRGSGPLVSPVYWCGRMIVGPGRGGHRPAELPDGRRGWIAAKSIRTSKRAMGIDQRIRSLLGVPYLWGGRTPLGLDCSAFVQLVLDEQDIALPRDAHDQFRACRKLSRSDEPAHGDLLFFGSPRGRVGHVGLMLEGGYFAHARGRVRLASVDPRNPLCDKELMDQLRGVRRPPRSTAKRPDALQNAGESS